MRLRTFTIVLTLGLLPANTWAQASWPGDSPYFSIPAIGRAIVPLGPLPQIGLPLPQIGLPLPQIGMPPAPVEMLPREGHARPWRHQWGERFTPWPYMVMVVPAFAPPAAPIVSEPAVPAAAAKGSLVFGVQPASAEVFVDGYYAGGVENFSGDRGGVFLEAGPHTIELRAPGYEAVSVNLRIVANEAIIYRRELKLLETTLPVPPMEKRPTTIYMIPGCYVGNVPPKDAGLPATCDVTRAQIFPM